MNRYELRVIPHGSLFLGGYSAAEGKGANVTAQDRRGFLAPGSTLRGAIRESALRLLRGAERNENLVTRLFGDRASLTAGKIRIGPLYAEGEEAQLEVSVRHHVSLERATRAAAEQRLFSTRATPIAPGLALRGELEILDDLDDEEWDLLRSAIALTDQLGGGRGRGLGLVRVELGERMETAAITTADPAATVEALETILARHGGHRREIVLRFEALEPLQLGLVKDPGNHERTVEVLGGSVLRGAIAAAMGRAIGDRQQREAALEQVFGGEDPVLFGDGLPAAAGVIAPMTLLQGKDGETVGDQALELCVDILRGQPKERPANSKSAKGCWAPDDLGWRRVDLPRRLVTRSARNAMDGRSHDGQLYSVEVIDPAFEGIAGKEPEPLYFHLPVRGPASSLRRIVAASQHGLLVGGTRSRGFGRIALRGVHDPELPTLTTRHLRWVAALEGRGIPRQQAESTGVLLARGFLAIHQPRLTATLERLGLELLGGESRRKVHGGWNSRANLPRTTLGGFEAGSVFIVRSLEGNIFDALLELEEHGLGPGRADGWGRLIACHPIHMDCLADTRRPTSERS